MRVVGSVLEGLGEVLGRVLGGLGRVLGGLGAVLGGLGAPFGGSVALLGANMAEKSHKRAKKVVWANVPHPLEEEKWRQEAAQGSPKGSQMEPKWERKSHLKSISIFKRFSIPTSLEN